MADGSRHDSAADMAALADEVRGLGCSPFWADVQKIIAPEMRPSAKPYVWRFAEIEPRLRRAAELVPVEEAERRAFVFLNPGLPGRIATTPTLYAAYSIYNGGEHAPVHRHTASAARIGLMGEGGYTTVEGEKNLISRGDLVLTPNWAWHDHGNDGAEPNIWFDILDVPLTMYLSAMLFDMDYREEGDEVRPNRMIQTPRRIEDGNNNPFGFGGVLPEKSERQFFFHWANTRRALDLAKVGGVDPHRGVSVRLSDPRNGRPLTDTIDFSVRLLPAGMRTKPQRQMANSVFLVMEGRGYTEIGGQRLDWQENDVFCVPTWTWYEHQVDTGRDAVLYDMSDSPLMGGIGCYRRQGRDNEGRERALRETTAAIRPGAARRGYREGVMLKVSKAIALVLGALAAVPTVHAQETLRVGLVSTLTGPGAGLGLEVKNGWDIGMATVGGKIGGLETQVFVVDDQFKTDVAVSAVDQLLAQHKVHVVAGILWSNVLLAIYDRTLKSDTILLTTNAGAPQPAGEKCSPLFMTTSWQNDQFMETTALLVKADGVKSVVLIAPNYQAGKDLMTAFPRNYDGKIVDQILFKLGTTDFQAELSVISAKKPEAVVVFAPGAMAVAFLKQWHASGLGKSIKLYPINMVDALTLPAIGDTVIGTSHVSPYDPTSTSEANQAFVKAYVAKTGRIPTQYAAQAYDGVMVLDAGVRAVGGKLSDKAALMRAMRTAEFQSVRGKITFNINNFPIQDFYKLEVVLGPDQKPTIKGAGVVVKSHKDYYHTQCKLTW